VINQFCCGIGIHSMWKNWRFQNCRCNMFCVGNGTLISQHIFNTQTLSCQLWDDKSIPALKKFYFMGRDHLDSILGSYSILGIDFSPMGHSTSKNTWTRICKPFKEPMNWFQALRNRFLGIDACAGIFKQSIGARKWVGIGLSYRPARLHRLAELIVWNRFLGFLKV
jgi:hypothetical protein